MSAKQLRKLQAKREAARQETRCEDTAAELATAEASVDQAASEPQGQVSNAGAKAVRAGFSALALGSDNSDQDEDSDRCNDGVESAPPKLAVAGAATKKGKQKKKKSKKKREGALDEDDVDDDALLDRFAADVATPEMESSEAQGQKSSVLAMSKSDFCADREHRRVFKDSGRGASGGVAGKQRLAVRARGGHEGRIAHHHRLVLIEPGRSEPWPRPEGCAEMIAGCDGNGVPNFRIRSTPMHTRISMEFVTAQLTHDPNVVQEFVQERPFCVEGLLTLAEICRSSGENMQAFAFLRRAVYAVECNFAAGFSPLRQVGVGRVPQVPAVAVELPAGDDPLWPGWPWLAALFAYLLSLQRQGLPRTALEVCKLLLAMLLPRDPLHVLVHLDVICLHAGQHAFLQQLASCLAAEYLEGNVGCSGESSNSTAPLLDSFQKQDALSVGEKVLRKGQEAVVVKIDRTLDPPSFTVRMLADGSEVGTEREFLQKLPPIVARLDRNLPNYSYSVALARRLGADGVADSEFMEALNHVVVADIIAPEQGKEDESVHEEAENALTSTHAALMRAMLLFPQVLRPLLESTNAKTKVQAPAGSPCRSTWEELLERRPFAGCSEFKHGRHFLAHALIADAYARHSSHFWRPEAMQCWLHACAGRLVRLSESSLFDGELTAARRAWSCSQLALETTLTTDYARFSTSEVAPEWKVPAVLQEMTPVDPDLIQQQAADLGAALREVGELLNPQEELRAVNNADAAAAEERRALVQQQDEEYRESLAVDQARIQTESSEREGAVVDAGLDVAAAQLTEMGFDAALVQRTLAATNGDAEAALEVLTS